MLEKCIQFTRRHGDQFFFDILIDFLEQCEQKSINFKVFSGILNVADIRVIDIYLSNATDNGPIVIAHTDTIGSIEKFYELVAAFPDRKFLLFSTQLGPEHAVGDNLQIVYWGTDVLLWQNDYQVLSAVTDKMIHPKFHWISIAGASRQPRVFAAMFIKGLGLDKSGFMRIDPYPLHDYSSWQEYCSWYVPFGEPREILSLGFDQLKHNYSQHHKFEASISGAQYVNFKVNQRNNCANFDLHFRDLYKQSVVELVNEATFEEPGYMFSEKFHHSVYGMNIPVVLGSRYIVNHLREIGFDMFDDVVSNDHDRIESPAVRIIDGITKNQRLFSDRDHALAIWKKCENRLIDNYEFAINHLHDTIRQRVYNKFQDLLYWLQ